MSSSTTIAGSSRRGCVNEGLSVCGWRAMRSSVARRSTRPRVAGAYRFIVTPGVSTTVDVGLPDSIERTLVGKARRVIDKRPKG